MQGVLAVGQSRMGPAKQELAVRSQAALRNTTLLGILGWEWLAVLPDSHAVMLDVLLCQILSKIGLCFKVM